MHPKCDLYLPQSPRVSPGSYADLGLGVDRILTTDCESVCPPESTLKANVTFNHRGGLLFIGILCLILTAYTRQ